MTALPAAAASPCRYTNTTAVISRISFIDGDKGILRYRGYPIEELAEKAHFMEVAHCVVYGDLPTKEQLDTMQVRHFGCIGAFCSAAQRQCTAQ